MFILVTSKMQKRDKWATPGLASVRAGHGEYVHLTYQEFQA